MGWDHEYKDADKYHKIAHRLIADWHRSLGREKDEPLYDIERFAIVVPLKNEDEVRRVAAIIKEHGYGAETYEETSPLNFNLPRHIRVTGPAVSIGVLKVNQYPFRQVRVRSYRRRRR